MESNRHKKSLTELLEKYDPNRLGSADADMAVGREFGSPEYERMTAQDHAVVQSNLTQLIEICSKSAGPLQLEDWQIDDSFRVQSALSELGQDVSVSIAVRVWQHYSNSILAGWLTGADTVASATDALYSYCLHAPAGGFTPEPPGPAGYD